MTDFPADHTFTPWWDENGERRFCEQWPEVSVVRHSTCAQDADGRWWHGRILVGCDVFEDPNLPDVSSRSLMNFGMLCSKMEKARTKLWQLIEDTPDLTWLLPTAFLENVIQLTPERWTDRHTLRPLFTFPSNVWIGSQVVRTQAEFDTEWWKLREIPCAKRFMQIEPSEEIEVKPIGAEIHDAPYGPDWIIASGDAFFYQRHVHSLRDQCVDAQVPFWDGDENRGVPE